jgi:hypothetical protein
MMMRYTAKKAERLVNCSGLEYIQRWSCRHPDIAAFPVQVHMRLGENSTNYMVHDNEWHTFRVVIPLQDLGRELLFRIEASRTWNPGDRDNRELGVLLQEEEWINTAGLYKRETWANDGGIMAGKPYRWGGPAMQMLVPDPGEYLAIPLLIAHPDANQRPVNVVIRVNGTVATNITCNNQSWQKIIVAVPAGDGTEPERKAADIHVSVDRTWRPEDYGTDDKRLLGAAIGQIERVRDYGFYEEEQLQDGTRYRWAGKEAVWEQKANREGKLIIQYLVNHRDMVLAPITWSMYVNTHKIVEKRLAKPGWNTEILHVKPGETCTIKANVNRTYLPVDYGVDDTREHGFAIKIQ